MGIQPKRALVSPAVAITRGDVERLLLIHVTFLSCRALWEFSVGKDENGEPLVPFPVTITEADEARIQGEWEAIQRDASMCNELLARLDIPLDGEGVVKAENYEAAKCAIEEAKEEPPVFARRHNPRVSDAECSGCRGTDGCTMEKPQPLFYKSQVLS